MIAVLLSPQTARAFELMKTRDGVPLHWPEPHLEYGVVFDSFDLKLSAASRAAWDTWSFAPGSSFTATYAGPHAEAAAADGRSTIAAPTTWDPAFGDPERAIAFTALVYDTRTGTIGEADLLLNAERFTFDGTPGSFDAQSVILHEAGHALGLGHSCGDPGGRHRSCFSIPDDPPGERERILGAVMAPGLSPAVERRVLGADDLAGLAAAYPGDRVAPAFAAAVIERPCPGAQVIVSGSGLEGLTWSLRQVDGSTASVAVLEAEAERVVLDAAAAPEAADLLLRDDHAGASLIGLWPEAPRCATPDPEPVVPQEEGCTCAATEAEASLTGVLALMLVLAARRRTR